MSINSCKEMKDEAEFESWSRNHSSNHTSNHGNNGGYGNQGVINQVTDAYSMSGSYYPVSTSMFHYTTPNDHNNSAWSNGTGHSEMTFLTGYGTTGDATGQSHHSNAHYMDMFGSQNSFGYAFFPGSGTTASGGEHFWGTTPTGPAGKQTQRGQLPVGPYRNVHDEQSYYQRDVYSDTVNSVKHLDTQMSALNLDHIKTDQFNSSKMASSNFGSNNSYESNKRFDSIGASSNNVIGQAPPKKMSWASVASQPAKPSQKSLKTKLTAATSPAISTTKHSSVASSVALTSFSIIEPIGAWETKNGANVGLKSGSSSLQHQPQPPPQQQQQYSQQQQQQQQQHQHHQTHSLSNPRIDPNQSNSGWNSNSSSRNLNRTYLPLNANNLAGNNGAHQAQHNVGMNSVNNHSTHSHHLQQQHPHHQQQHQTQHQHPHGQQQTHQSGQQQPRVSPASQTSAASSSTVNSSNTTNNASSLNAVQHQKHIRASESTNSTQNQHQQQQQQHHQQQQQQQQQATSNNQLVSSSDSGTNYPSHPVLDKLRIENSYNPKDFDLAPKNARFFIIKSYSEDDIHRSIKYSIWCSTEHGNKRLDNAYKSQENKGPIFLFFSVNGSGHFCGVAQMTSSVDYNSNSSVWSQDKWKGQFKVKWIYVKDVPNAQLRHIRLENNENKPVTNSRDTQEVPYEKGKAVLKNIHNFKHSTSIFDDFLHYEKRQEEENARKYTGSGSSSTGGEGRGGAPNTNNNNTSSTINTNSSSASSATHSHANTKLTQIEDWIVESDFNY